MTRAERFSALVNVVLLVAAIAVLAHPRGPLRSWFSESRADGENIGPSERRELELMATNVWRGAAGGGHVFVFSDYQCSACREAHGVLEQFLAENAQVSVSYLHFPLDSHPRAELAARAAICARGQGVFLRMHTRLLETDNWLQTADWAAEAQVVGIPDVGRFLDCMQQESTVEEIRKSKELGRRLGVLGTPTWVLPSGTVSGGFPWTRLARDAVRPGAGGKVLSW